MAKPTGTMSEGGYRELVDSEKVYRGIVELAGGIFVGVRDDSVLFRSDSEGRTLSLYLSACRTVEDVQLALKAEREQVQDEIYTRGKGLGDASRPRSIMETQSFAEIFSLLPERENPKQASVDMVPYILHEDHRWLLPIVHFAQQCGALPKPCTVIMFDRHHDALDPLKRSTDDLHRLRSAPTLQGVISLCAEERLSKIDDDWLKAGMELGLFGDAVIFGVADPLHSDKYRVYADHTGVQHRIEMPTSLPRVALAYKGLLSDAFLKMDIRNDDRTVWDILGWEVSLKSLRFVPGLPKVLFTIDLDCFAIEWSDYIFPWPTAVFEREFLELGTHDWTGQRFFQELAKKAGLVTFARESGCCGGPENAASILENVIHYGFGGGFSF